MKIIAKVRMLAACLLCLLLISCSSITFVQVEQSGEQKNHSRWHHATLNGMVEVSKPLDIRTVCHNKAWTKITTEHTAYNWLAEVIVPGLPNLLLYSAWTNQVQCHESPGS